MKYEITLHLTTGHSHPINMPSAESARLLYQGILKSLEEHRVGFFNVVDQESTNGMTFALHHLVYVTLQSYEPPPP